MAVNKDNENQVSHHDNYIHIPSHTVDEMTFGCGEYIFQQMKKNGKSVAQIDSVTGRQETYEGLLSRSIRTALAMKDKGLSKGDVVSLCSFNNMDYSVTMIASLFIGVHMAALDPTAPLLDIIHCIKIIKPKILFCEMDFDTMMNEAITKSDIKCEIVVFGNTKTHIPFSDYLTPKDSEEDFRPTPYENMNETASILFSSGTSGLPKAVCVNHYAIYNVPLQQNRLIDDCSLLLTLSSPYWISNLIMLCMAVYANKPRLICKLFDQYTIIKTIQDYQCNKEDDSPKVECVLFTPVNYNHFIKNPTLCKYNTNKLKYIFVGGSSSTSHQILKLMDLFPNTTIYNVYGMTEVGSAALQALKLKKSTLLKQERVSIGRIIPGYYYKVVDSEIEKTVGPKTTGELRIKSASLMHGYYLRPDLTNEAFDNEGYYKTGDGVYYDEEYNFYYVDRLKEIFKYKGWHISPTIIEAELITHPDVIECAVVGTPHELDGDVPTAAVVLRKNTTIKAENIVKYVNDRLTDRYYLGGGVFIINSLCRTATGKVKRNDVRNIVMKMKKKM